MLHNHREVAHLNLLQLELLDVFFLALSQHLNEDEEGEDDENVERDHTESKATLLDFVSSERYFDVFLNTVRVENQSKRLALRLVSRFVQGLATWNQVAVERPLRLKAENATGLVEALFRVEICELLLDVIVGVVAKHLPATAFFVKLDHADVVTALRLFALDEAELAE